MGKFIPDITEKYEIPSDERHAEFMRMHKEKYKSEDEPKALEVAEKLIECIKETEPTYAEAYTILNLVYSQLKFESHFTKMPTSVKHRVQAPIKLYKDEPEFLRTIVEELINTIKQLELTYRDLYIILDLIHSQLEYETKFLKVSKEVKYY
ncbi:hypothetical protein ACWEWU_13935 [Staphylococcus xylosus]